jgi:hypothetical protein
MKITVKTAACPGCCGREKGTLNCQSQAAQACLCGWAEFIPSFPARFYRKRTKVGSMLRHDYANATCASETVVTVGMSCRTRGGTASLIGFSEFASPSTPPKKYRIKTWTGRHDRCNYSTQANCNAGTPIQGSDASIRTLVCTYNKTTGALTSTGSIVTNQNLGVCPATTVISTIYDCSLDFLGGNQNTDNFTYTVTQTQINETGIPGCTFHGVVWTKDPVSTLQEQLTDEDTETDAISRLLAGAGGTWSSWTVTGNGSGGTCIPSSCCLSRYEQRTTGFGFVYQEAQFQINQTGLVANTPYNVSVDLWRRAFGTGSFAFWKTITVAGTTDSSGVLFIDQQSVPIDVGFETYAATAHITEGFLTETADAWDYTGEYSVPACTLGTVDNSTRTINGVPSGKPNEADYSGFVTVATDRLEQDVIGDDTCHATGGSSSAKLVGSLVDSLSEEDTMADAISRAFASASWSGSGCVSAIQNRNPSENCFGVKKARVQAILTGLTPGNNYNGVIVFQGRIVGSTDPWGTYGQQVINFTAVTDTETTPWVDVPLVSGMEIQASYCYAAPA